jgi:hypothetical protein
MAQPGCSACPAGTRSLSIRRTATGVASIPFAIATISTWARDWTLRQGPPSLSSRARSPEGWGTKARSGPQPSGLRSWVRMRGSGVAPASARWKTAAACMIARQRADHSIAERAAKTNQRGKKSEPIPPPMGTSDLCRLGVRAVRHQQRHRRGHGGHCAQGRRHG